MHSHENEIKKENIKKLWLVFGLTVFYMLAEFVGGYISNSLALMADAVHMLSDAAALGLSIFAAWLSMKPANFEKTFGYHRVEIFAAFLNGVMLLAIVGFIVYEAILRLKNPPDVNAPILIWVATGGLLINIISAKILHSSCKDNLNVKGTYLHVLGDMLGSLGAVIVGIAILFFDLHILDPIISFLIASLILLSAFGLISEALDILLEASPSSINVESINNALLELPTVEGVHHLHVWSISSGKTALSVHIVTSSTDLCQTLIAAQTLLKEKFGLDHVTIQVEPPNFSAEQCSF